MPTERFSFNHNPWIQAGGLIEFPLEFDESESSPFEQAKINKAESKSSFFIILFAAFENISGYKYPIIIRFISFTLNTTCYKH